MSARNQNRTSTMQRLSSLVVALALLLGGASAALAHAHLTRAQPAADSTVKTAPTALTLWFSEALEPGYCTVQVTDASDGRVDGDAAIVDPTDPRILRVALKPLAAGSYKIAWRVVSVDSHTTSGNFAFRVAP
jgi:methionine-rich copper-binding protein CopC